MTARQLDYIRSLAQSKDLNLLTPEQQTFVAKLVAGEVDPQPAAASRVIDALLALPDGAEATATPARTSTAQVDAGRYALVDEDGAVKFYTVDRPTEGRWAGYTFLNAMGSDERYPIRDRNAKAAIMAKIAADPGKAMRRYAAELGRCAYCGRELTDETSRAAGIGPDCAQHHGIDRSVWARQAELERADRVRAEASRPDPRTDPTRDMTPEQADLYWSNEFAKREAAQERAAYEHEMRTQGV